MLRVSLNCLFTVLNIRRRLLVEFFSNILALISGVTDRGQGSNRTLQES